METGFMFASKAVVQLITNPFVGPLTNRWAVLQVSHQQVGSPTDPSPTGGQSYRPLTRSAVLQNPHQQVGSPTDLSPKGWQVYRPLTNRWADTGLSLTGGQRPLTNRWAETPHQQVGRNPSPTGGQIQTSH